MKTEPDDYSIDDLERDRIVPWDGIRNHQARNIIRDEIKAGDDVLIYHSGVSNPGIAGCARIAGDVYPDSTARDKESEYFDHRSTDNNPIWYCVDVEFVSKLPRFVSLREIKSTEGLANMMVVRRGIRLSVQPVEAEHFNKIVHLGNQESS
jgi:predicted RNA-binding protein with PUA-like domain